jgi:SRSO17 transposase
VFLGYASARGHALVDARLYLPAEWTADRDRCRAAGVPDDVAFATKPALALAMVRQARAAGHLRADWVTGDAVYGGNPGFRDALDADGLQYVLEVPTTLGVCPVTGAGPATPLGGGDWRPRWAAATGAPGSTSARPRPWGIWRPRSPRTSGSP